MRSPYYGKFGGRGMDGAKTSRDLLNRDFFTAITGARYIMTLRVLVGCKRVIDYAVKVRMPLVT